MPSVQAEEGARLLAEGRAEEAVAAFKAGLARSARDPECLLGLARAHLSRAELPEARTALERLLAVEPRHPEASSHLALVKAREGDDEAFAQLQALGRGPEARFFDAFNLGAALAARGDLPAAEAAFSKALLLQPASAHARFELGRLALLRGDLGRALAQLKEAAELSPRASAPRVLLARAHERLGQKAAAVQALMGALTAAPREKTAYLELVQLCLRVGVPQVALTAARTLRAVLPGDPDGPFLEGTVLLAQGDAARAQDALHDAVRMAPEHWRAKLALARAYEVRGEPDVTRRLLEEAHALAPSEPGPASALAAVYLRKAETVGRAKALLAKVLADHPDDPVANLHLARALQGTDPAQALEHARRAQRAEDPELRAQADALAQTLPS